MAFYSQNGWREPLTLKSRFQTWNFPNEVWVGVPKIPDKIFIFEEILKGTIQLSVDHSIFHLEFMSVCVAALFFVYM